jgi:hypothetical protein
MGEVLREPVELTDTDLDVVAGGLEILRELSDTELDAVSGGSVVVGASSSVDIGFAAAASTGNTAVTFVGGGLAVALVNSTLVCIYSQNGFLWSVMGFEG